MPITRQTKVIAAAVAAALLVVYLSSVIFDMSFERAVYLAPVLVLSAGVIVGLFLFWIRVAIRQWRGEDGEDGAPIPGDIPKRRGRPAK